jgi:hypothetical protein
LTRRLLYEDVKRKFEENDCKLLSVEYKNARTPLDYVCECGTLAKIRYDDFRVGKRCPTCKNRKNAESKRVPLSDAIALMVPEGYKVLGYDDNEGRRSFIVECPEGHQRKTYYHYFKNGHRCDICARSVRADKLRLSLDDVRKRFSDEGCTLLSTEYTHWNDRLLYRCSCGNTAYTYLSAITKGIKCGCQRLRGEDSPVWNHDLTQEERLTSRNYPEYREWVKLVYERDNYTCAKCNERGGRLNAHHILNYSSNKSLRTELSNGITLCSDCHKDFHSKYGLKRNTLEQLKQFLKEDAE